MIDANPLIVLIIMFSGFLLVAMLGIPVAFGLGGIGILTAIIFWGPHTLFVGVASSLAIGGMYALTCMPLFIFLACVMRESEITEDLFDSLRLWFGGVPGGMAMAVVVISCVIGAMSGIAGSGIAILGTLALPYMLRRGYSKDLSMGPIMAGAVLAFLIPPSNVAILYGAFVQVSIGKLFLGGLFPGLILAALYIIYIGIRCHFQPALGPALPVEERGTFRQKIMSLKSVILPMFVIMSCLGVIFLGIASPTEAAAIGVLGSLIASAMRHKLSWSMIKTACYESFRITGLCWWVLIGAFCFKSVFVGVGGPQLAQSFIEGLNVSPLTIIILMQISYLFLGCYIDEITIMMLSFPAYIPIVRALGFDMVWFGVLFAVNTQLCYLSPPVGACLFYMKGVAPKEITMGEVYRAALPFLPLQLVGLILLLYFPELALWLPRVVFSR